MYYESILDIGEKGLMCLLLGCAVLGFVFAAPVFAVVGTGLVVSFLVIRNYEKQKNEILQNSMELTDVETCKAAINLMKKYKMKSFLSQVKNNGFSIRANHENNLQIFKTFKSYLEGEKIAEIESIKYKKDLTMEELEEYSIFANYAKEWIGEAKEYLSSKEFIDVLNGFCKNPITTGMLHALCEVILRVKADELKAEVEKHYAAICESCEYISSNM